MAFRGDLDNIDLASVLQNLLHNEQTGTLRLHGEESEAFLYFENGNVSMYSSGTEAHTPVGEYLSRSGDVTPKQITTASKRLRGRRNLTTVLSSMGVEPDKISDAVRRFVEEEVCDLFTWESGRFEFTEGAPPNGIFDSDMAAAKLSIVPDALILEAARRADTWDKINSQIRSQSEIFVLRKESAPTVKEDFEPEVAEVAGLLDGRRDAATIVEESGLGRFPVLQALTQLLARGAARSISLTEVVRLAETAAGVSEFDEAVRLYRRALEVERNNLECRRGLIAALEGAGEKAEAGAERKLLAATLHDMGRLGDAAEELLQTIEAVPTDITAREKHIALLKEMGETQLAEIASIDLGQAYMSLGIAEKARQTFQDVIKDRPHDPARVGIMLAEACVKAGDVSSAVEAYRRSGSIRIAAEEFDSAADAFGEILNIQPENAEAQKRIEDINSGKLQYRKRRWRRVRIVALLAAVASLGLAWLVYDWLARDFLDEMSIEAMACVERGEPGDAVNCYDAVRGCYPFTRAAASARRLREALSARAAKAPPPGDGAEPED